MGVYDNTSFSVGKAPKLGSYKVSPQLLVRPCEDKDYVEFLLHFTMFESGTEKYILPFLWWPSHAGRLSESKAKW